MALKWADNQNLQAIPQQIRRAEKRREAGVSGDKQIMNGLRVGWLCGWDALAAASCRPEHVSHLLTLTHT